MIEDQIVKTFKIKLKINLVKKLSEFFLKFESIK